MLQNLCKTLGFKKIMVYKIPLGGEVNHIQPVAYCLSILLQGVISLPVAESCDKQSTTLFSRDDSKISKNIRNYTIKQE